jgi:hypothetical protein
MLVDLGFVFRIWILASETKYPQARRPMRAGSFKNKIGIGAEIEDSKD